MGITKQTKNNSAGKRGTPKNNSAGNSESRPQADRREAGRQGKKGVVFFYFKFKNRNALELEKKGKISDA